MITREESDRRLLVLADFLEKLPPDRFDYRHWAGTQWEGKADLSCGTTACALGWATAIPEFQKLGVCLRRDIEGEPCVTFRGDASDRWGLDESFRAAQRLFRISPRQSEFLFRPDEELRGFDWASPSESAGPRVVASHIRRFVKARKEAGK